MARVWRSAPTGNMPIDRATPSWGPRRASAEAERFTWWLLDNPRAVAYRRIGMTTARRAPASMTIGARASPKRRLTSPVRSTASRRYRPSIPMTWSPASVVVGRAGRFHAGDARDLGARGRQDDPAVGRHPQRHRLLAAADADPMDRRAQLACLDGHREGRGGRRWDDLLVRRELLLVEQPGPNRPCGCLDTKYPIAGGDLELAAPRQEAQQQLDRLRGNQRPLPAQSRHRCHVQPVTIGGDHLIALQEDAAQMEPGDVVAAHGRRHPGERGAEGAGVNLAMVTVAIVFQAGRSEVERRAVREPCLGAGVLDRDLLAVVDREREPVTVVGAAGGGQEVPGWNAGVDAAVRRDDQRRGHGSVACGDGHAARRRFEPDVFERRDGLLLDDRDQGLQGAHEHAALDEHADLQSRRVGTMRGATGSDLAERPSMLRFAVPLFYPAWGPVFETARCAWSPLSWPARSCPQAHCAPQDPALIQV
jgi:hypothetical protein